ncbi:MAG: amidase [Acidimicrobiia bacterium]
MTFTPVDDELAHWDATETAIRIAAGDVSAAEVMEAAVDRARAAAPLAAVVTETYEQAVAAAGLIEGPFSGVPTFVKDLANLAGVRTGFGTRALEDYIPTESDPFVDLLIGTGLVSLGKSAAPEFGLTATTEPLDAPPTRNPWDLDRSVGGSSGGAAALVAARVVPIASASDGGGSIRIPAAATGVIGLKPSRGRFPSPQGDSLPVNILTSGVLTRTIRDQVRFYAAAEAQLRTRRLPPVGEVTPMDRPLRIGLATENPVTQPDADVVTVVEDTARLLESLGHTVERVPLIADETFVDDFLTYWAYLAFMLRWTSKAVIDRSFDGRRMEPWTQGLVGLFARRAHRFRGIIASLRAFESAYADMMRTIDVVLTPVTATTAPPIGHLAGDLPFEEHRDRVTRFVPYPAAWNVAGAPALSLPMGHGDDGLPVGVQLGGRLGEESTLLSLGLQVEAARPFPML